MSPEPSPPLDNDDLLSDILIRLPPSPSSLPRASLVCKRWRRLVSDPVFLRRFRVRHRRNAPILGFFTEGERDVSFTPTLGPPDGIPPGRFSLELGDRCRILSCRHGLVLILTLKPRELLVWETVSGDLTRLAVPPGFVGVPPGSDDGEEVVLVQFGAVLRATGDVHGGEGHSTPFLLALVGGDGTLLFARLYSSETGVWSNLISTAWSLGLGPLRMPGVRVGDSIYWLLLGCIPTGILEFDLDRQRLVVIDVPPSIAASNYLGHWVMPAEDGGLGFLSVTDYNAQLWTREMDRHGSARWVVGRTIELDKLLSLNSDEGFPPMVFGYDEEDNLFFLATHMGVFMIQLESMKFKKPFELSMICFYHPFRSVYAAGI